VDGREEIAPAVVQGLHDLQRIAEGRRKLLDCADNILMREGTRLIKERPLQVFVERKLAALKCVDYLAVAGIEGLVIEPELPGYLLALLVVPGVAKTNSADVEENRGDRRHC